MIKRGRRPREVVCMKTLFQFGLHMLECHGGERTTPLLYKSMFAQKSEHFYLYYIFGRVQTQVDDRYGVNLFFGSPYHEKKNRIDAMKRYPLDNWILLISGISNLHQGVSLSSSSANIPYCCRNEEADIRMHLSRQNVSKFNPQNMQIKLPFKR